MQLKIVLILFSIILLFSTIAPAFSSNVVDDNSWTLKTPMQQNRGALGAVATNGKIYAIGGAINCVYNTPSSTWEIVGTNEEYDPILDNWTTKASMPTARAYFAIAAFQNKVYCFGGLVGTGLFPYQNTDILLPGAKWCNTTEVYDPATNLWETKSPMPITQGIQFTATTMGDRIFLFGGVGAQPVMVYDPTTDQWDTPLNNSTNITQSWTKAVIDAYISAGLSTGDSQYTSTHFNENIYVLSRSLFASGTRALFIYNTANQSWTLGKTVTSETRGITAIATNGSIAPVRLYFITSTTNNIYNPKDDTWQIGKPMQIIRFDFAIAAINDKIFVIGGYSSDDLISGMMINEEYTPMGFGTIEPTISDISLERITNNELSLNFIVDRPVNWVGYSLDGKANVTISGNATITGLEPGTHNITIFVRDTYENFGASKIIEFQVAAEPFSPMIMVTIIIIATICLALVLYFWRKK